MKTSVVSGVRLTDRQEEIIHELVDAGLYISLSDFIRDAVREKIESIKVLNIRDVTKSQAKKEIVDYISKVKEAYTSDISEILGIDLELVFSIMNELKKEGRVQ